MEIDSNHTVPPARGRKNSGWKALFKMSRGQTTVMVALSILILLVFVGLAVDGGSMYANRRNAQNSADAAALAGTQVMLPMYDQMVIDNAYDVPGDSNDDHDIDAAITDYANKHGIARSDLEAYYVNDDKQLVNSVQVGTLHSVPWDQGAKGIVVKNRSQSDSFFMKLLGWNKIGASATSSAFMGLAVDSGTGIGVMPVGLFTDTLNIDSLQFEQEYTLISSDITDTMGSGNWGYLDFNSKASANVDQAWIACGYNPVVGTLEQWREWCSDPHQQNVGQAVGPTQYFPCVDLPGCTIPSDTAAFLPTLRWGDGADGWWLAGESGQSVSNCHELEQLVDDIDGREFLVPIFDHWDIGNGNNSRFHLARVAKFRITSAQINCHPNHGDAHWSIKGIYENYVQPGSTGRHGDIRHTSSQVVFLDN